MKDKRTYTNKKEHGEDMSHENESKITNEDRGPLDLTLLTEQYKADLWEYKKRESLYIQTKNQLDGTKQIVIEMSSTIRELKTQNDNFQAEIARLNEEIQLLEMQIKK
jgi:septal ring factor EnvC (AmiA/AmiB activator)